MTDDPTFRMLLLIGIAAVLPIMVFHRLKAHTSETLDRRQEGWIVLATVRPFGMAFGSPGGDGQDQWQLAFLLRLAHGHLNLQEAIEAPAFHSDHWPSSFWPRQAHPARLSVEERFGSEVVAELRRRGHDLVVGGPWSEGRLSAVSRDPDGILRAGANPRGMQGYAVGR